jgi:hypothetical protein
MFINKQMKKYQPANSSFSLFYGEKRSIDRHTGGSGSRGSEHSQRPAMFRLPALPSKKTLKELQQLPNAQKSRISNSRSYSQGSQLHNQEFLVQLEAIDKFGGILTDYSS